MKKLFIVAVLSSSTLLTPIYALADSTYQCSIRCTNSNQDKDKAYVSVKAPYKGAAKDYIKENADQICRDAGFEGHNRALNWGIHCKG